MGLSTIQWCDYTFNPWIGCRKVAPECANCYAETLDRNRYSKTLAPGTKENPVSHWGSGPRHRTKTWGDPLKWNRHAESIDWMGVYKATRPRVFCASLADWLDDENVPIEWFADLLKLIHDTPNLDHLLLTKRPQNWKERVELVLDWSAEKGNEAWREAHTQWLWNWRFTLATPTNVWIGVSAGADQAAALDIPARVHFLSCEPMLRPLDTTHAAGFDWIIFGGESGSKARPCNIEWIRQGVKFCREHSHGHTIAPFVKQLGSHCLGKYIPSLASSQERNLNAAGMITNKHGGDMDEWPEDLRVREFPEVV